MIYRYTAPEAEYTTTEYDTEVARIDEYRGGLRVNDRYAVMTKVAPRKRVHRYTPYDFEVVCDQKGHVLELNDLVP